MLGFSSFISAQCLNATNGQYPGATYTPATCDGVTTNSITALAYADEYSKVNVVAGETYQFSSSKATDVITISNEAGDTSLAYGENGYVLWVSDMDGVVRFYTHKDNTCAGDGTVFRVRGVICGTPPSCLPPNGVDVSALGMDTVTLEWIASNSAPADGYDYILTQDSTAPDAGATPDATLAAGTLTVSFDSLTEMTQYYFWVRANCGGGDTSTWSGTDFTTLGPPPVNDDATGALPLTLDIGQACGPNKITGISNAYTTPSPEIDPSCMDQYNPSFGNGDMWYSIVAPAETITINISDITGEIITVSSALYSGTPGNLTETGVCGNAATKTYNDLTIGETYYLRVWDYANDGIGEFSICGWYLDCVNPAAAYTVVSDCVNGEQFLVNVDITDMGSAATLTISDDQGSEPQTADVVNTYTFGPYANGTAVIFNIQNDQNEACFISSASQTQGACPPDCASAEVIAACGDETTVSISGAGAWNVNTCGFTTAGAEKVYSFTPSVTGLYSLQITSSAGGYVDYFYKEASGTCDATGWECIGDAIGAETNEIGMLNAGTQYLILLDGENTNQKDITFNIVCAPTCTNGTVNYVVVSDCANGEQFNVNVNITNMGTAVSYTISDDQGSQTQQATATGTFTFGPYANGTPVIYTVANNDDDTCVLTSTAQTQTACPPANDTCQTATVITSFPYAETLDASAASNNAGFITTCANAMNDGVWYTFVGDGGDITIDLDPTAWDPQLGIYTGTCGALVCVGTVDGFAAGDSETYTITASVPGTVYYLNAGHYSGTANNPEGLMDLEITTTVLGVGNNVFDTLKVYPNPVKNILNLSGTQNISNVTVFNMLGQQMMTKAINANESQIDMSHLASGTYFVKVAAENQVKTMKVIKQ